MCIWKVYFEEYLEKTRQLTGSSKITFFKFCIMSASFWGLQCLCNQKNEKDNFYIDEIEKILPPFDSFIAVKIGSAASLY